MFRAHNKSIMLHVDADVLNFFQRKGARNYPLGLIELLANSEGRPDFMAFFATTIASWVFDSGNEKLETLGIGEPLRYAIGAVPSAALSAW